MWPVDPDKRGLASQGTLVVRVQAGEGWGCREARRGSLCPAPAYRLQDTENCFSIDPDRDVGPEGEVRQQWAPGNCFRSLSLNFFGSQRTPGRC